MSAHGHRRRGLSAAERAKRLDAINARFAPYRREEHPLEALMKLIRLESLRAEMQIIGGRVYGLVETYEMRRRACVLRAWCAIELAKHYRALGQEGWVETHRSTARESLKEARRHARNAARARAEGRSLADADLQRRWPS